MSEAAPIVPFANLDQPPPILAVPPTTSSRSLYVVLVFGAIMVGYLVMLYGRDIRARETRIQRHNAPSYVQYALSLARRREKGFDAKVHDAEHVDA